MQQNQERIKSLEESIEAERAAHLETKFNSEIIQVIITLYMICSLYQWWARMLQWLGHLHFVVIVFSSVLVFVSRLLFWLSRFSIPTWARNYKVIRRHRSDIHDIHEIFMLYNKFFIDQACSVKMAGYQPRFSLVAIYKNAKKKKNSVNTQSYRPHAWAKTHVWWCVWFVFSNWMYSVNV